MRESAKKADMTGLWRRFKRTKSRALRNRLMEAYLPLVKYNAERIRAKLPDEIDQDDLISAGVFGLMDAIEAYDLDRGVKFETYCAPRIRGAILDELRSMDWVPRLVRARAHKLARVAQELESTLGRAPYDDEIAERMNLKREEFDKLLREATAVGQISLSRKCNETDSHKEVCEIDVIQDRRGRDPVGELQEKDLKDLLTRGLTRAERLILMLYYYEEMTMKEIGMALDLSESRVSQMHSAILERLREQLELRRKEFEP
ncbi:MAG: FliA/WhiG family RNA polymerase sigma factor [Planctomycetota bacterium]|nr:MAG: FliA/WhiG family RNA polymerase sigma factor [Planctomycetota bacterium]